MVHRPSDSRLLVNLLNHEKDYSKQLSTLLDQSQSSLASFSAYASASAPPTSQIIIQVAGALAGADEALRKYAGSLEQWQEQLESLKALEDEVGNVMRDREILVTRLIKLSKSQKPTRDSILASSSTSTLTKLPEVQTSTKLATAQSELQACEAHLAAKERELDVMRNAAITSGLSARCKALVECGWTWGEMGKEGLRAVESLGSSTHMNGNGTANGYAHTSPTLRAYKPLPDGPSSDLSSIGPSQSASQTTHANTEPIAAVHSRLHIPPAHLISDHTFPVEEEPGEGSSAGEEEDGFELRENERFAKRGSKVAPKSKANTDPVVDNRPKFPSVSSSTAGPNQIPKRTRRTSGSVLGCIAAFFHRAPAPEPEQGTGNDSSPTKKQGRWQTRTDKHLAKARKGKGSDSDDDSMQNTPVLPVAGFSRSPPALPSGSSPRLKKSMVAYAKRNTAAASSPTHIEPVDLSPGVLSDGGVDRRQSRRGKKVRRASADQPMSEPESSPAMTKKRKSSSGAQVEHRGKDAAPTVMTASAPTKTKRASIGHTQASTNGPLHASLPTETPLALSRNSSISKRSITSAASAPMNLSSKGTTAIYPSIGSSERPSGSSMHKRSASLDARPDDAKAPSRKHKKGQSTSSHATTPSRASTLHLPGNQSLMSIVEDVAKQNRESRMQQDPSAMLFVAKAPPPISASADFLKLPEGPLHPPPAQPPASHPPAQAPSSHPPSSLKTLPPRDKTPSQRSIPLTPTAPPPNVPVIHVPSPDMKPLRSAMRNISRSPSPIVLPLPASLPAPSSKPTSSAEPLANPNAAPRQAAPSGKPVLPVMNGVADDDDASSISSYETTHEILGEDADVEEENNGTPHGTPIFTVSLPLPTVPPPPAKEVQPPVSSSSQSSQSSGSTTVATHSTSAPARRKSVRMSLPPTFSATPPAIEDNDENDGTRGRRYEPWSSSSAVESGAGWRSRIKEPVERETWHDSSGSEDEEYSKAKRLLGRLSRKK